MLNVNDILVSKSGYNCTLVDFYKVVRTSKTNAWLQKLESRITSHDGYGQAGYVVPSDKVSNDVQLRRKIQTSEYGHSDYVKVSNYEYAYLWDGKEVAFDSYD